MPCTLYPVTSKDNTLQKIKIKKNKKIKIALCKSIIHSHNQYTDTDTIKTQYFLITTEIPHVSFAAIPTSFQIQGHILFDSIYMKCSEYSEL